MCCFSRLAIDLLVAENVYPGGLTGRHRTAKRTIHLVADGFFIVMTLLLRFGPYSYSFSTAQIRTRSWLAERFLY